MNHVSEYCVYVCSRYITKSRSRLSMSIYEKQCAPPKWYVNVRCIRHTLWSMTHKAPLQQISKHKMTGFCQSNSHNFVVDWNNMWMWKCVAAMREVNHSFRCKFIRCVIVCVLSTCNVIHYSFHLFIHSFCLFVYARLFRCFFFFSGSRYGLFSLYIFWSYTPTSSRILYMCVLHVAKYIDIHHVGWFVHQGVERNRMTIAQYI